MTLAGWKPRKLFPEKTLEGEKKKKEREKEEGGGKKGFNNQNTIQWRVKKPTVKPAPTPQERETNQKTKR